MDFSHVNPRISDGDYEFIPPSSPEIEDGAEVGAMTFKRPTPNMRFDKTDIFVVVAIRHSKRDPAGPVGSDLSDFSGLLNSLSVEVREIIYGVSDIVV